ncbi:MAG: Hsp20/alpha crystallin family protein [Dehalococcoidia bacterium]|nr:Hsp20/alpha crystallin family protein [Dehalococcoidia bacterium]
MVYRLWDSNADGLSLKDAMDRLLEHSVVRPQALASGATGGGAKVMPIDVFEKDSDYLIRAYLPGVKADDVDISAERETVTVKAHIPGEEEKDEVGDYRWIVGELGYGDVVRTVRLPVPVNGGAIEASMEEGVLTLSVPKAEEAKPRKIAVVAK